jgi:hypothetical protein
MECPYLRQIKARLKDVSRRSFSEITTGFAPTDFTVIFPKEYIEYPFFILTDRFYSIKKGRSLSVEAQERTVSLGELKRPIMV